jgi:hypothetical protein
MPAKLISGSEYRPLRPELRAMSGGFAELRGRVRARHAPPAVVMAECAALDPDSLHRAVGELGAASRPQDLNA